MSLSLFKNQFLFLGGIFFLVIGGGFFGVHFLLERLSEKDESVYQRLAEEKWQRDRADSLGEMKKKAELIFGSEELFSSLLLQEEDRVEYITFLEEIAVASNVEISLDVVDEKVPITQKPQEEEKEVSYGDDIESFDLRVRVEGGYNETLTFLHRIENAPVMIHIRSLSLQYGTDDQQGSPLSGSGILTPRSSEVIEVSHASGEESEGEEILVDLVRSEIILRTYIKKSSE